MNRINRYTDTRTRSAHERTICDGARVRVRVRVLTTPERMTFQNSQPHKKPFKGVKLSRCHCNGSLITIRFGKSIANTYEWIWLHAYMVVIRLISFRVALLTVNICKCVRERVSVHTVCTHDTDIKRTNQQNSNTLFFRIPLRWYRYITSFRSLAIPFTLLYIIYTRICIVWTHSLGVCVFFLLSLCLFTILNHNLAHCKW